MGRLGRRPRGETGTGPGALPKAIAALSRALPGGPSPETFRRAKFDLPEAVAELWSLLFSLLWLIHQEDKVSPRDLPDALEGQIRFVKWVLRCHGYGRQHFYQLPEVGSHGSCELLLAFSWLLAYLSLPEQFLFLRCVHQGDGVWISSCKDLARCPVPLALGPKGRVDIRYIQWLLGKLRFHWRNLYESQQEQCTLLNKIHLYTRGCHPDQSIGHLSVPETEILRFPESSKQLLQELESENSCLEAFLEWKHMELVYWQWMDTVLDTRPGGMPNTSKQDVFLPEILQNCSPKYVTREMDRVQKNLEALRERLQEVVNQQRAAWHMKVSKCSQRLPRPPELSTAKRKEIQEAVGYELTTLDQDCGVKRHPCGLQRLVFRKAREPNNSGAQSVTKIIQLLKREEASLERTLRRLQEECQQELAILAHGLEGVIWIPPPYPRR
ncbi:tubulin epsilon and delta complex protein 1 isoform X3 [Monodelphis domestica]|uniref:tubulin epsilon and delta complex protein 1 isoform X3 n=1 Tax=Monodelphis domestica TaxID=13616 RepID=UPI0024E1D728|nr:tubulin epsilon and delta complex protein 1 isoform X3 [Monodelphis domestica]